MQDKKEILRNILISLQSFWTQADGLLNLLDSKHIDNKLIDYFINMINKAIKETDEEINLNKLEVSLEILGKIRNAEKIDREQENNEIDELLQKINK